MRSLERELRRAVGRTGYTVSEEKVRRWGPERPATIAGVVLSSTLSPTPEFLRWVQSAVHDVESGDLQLDVTGIAQLEGKISWVRALDRRMGDKLRSRLVAALLTHG